MMLKLTHTDYRLPVIEALNSFELFETGTTAPMAVWGVDSDSGERGKYVVKFKNHNRMTPGSSAFEFLGAWMGIELDLHVVEPVSIHISAQFVETLLGKDGYKAANQSQGINFGSVYQAGLTQLPPHAFKLPANQVEQAKMLYVFDVFIQNADRGHQKPNVASDGNNLIIYDHELAFSFLRQLLFIRSKTPWILTPADSELYKNHFFYPYLKGMGIDLHEQVEKLTCFNNTFWNRVDEYMPKEFKNDELVDIKDYLQLFMDQTNKFTDSLNKTLA